MNKNREQHEVLHSCICESACSGLLAHLCAHGLRHVLQRIQVGAHVVQHLVLELLLHLHPGPPHSSRHGGAAANSGTEECSVHYAFKILGLSEFNSHHPALSLGICGPSSRTTRRQYSPSTVQGRQRAPCDAASTAPQPASTRSALSVPAWNHMLGADSLQSERRFVLVTVVCPVLAPNPCFLTFGR